MHLILLQINFNHPRYVLHYSYWLDAQLSELPERTQRLDELSWHLNTIEQVRAFLHFCAARVRASSTAPL
jgi:hypothetical protein